jgi:cytochrome c
MGPDDPIDDSLGSPRKVPAFVGYFVLLVGCFFAIFYAYKASRENAPAPMEQAQPTSRESDQAATTPSPKPGPVVAETTPSVAQPKAAASPPQAVASPTPQPPQGPTPQPPQAAPPPPAAAAQAPAAAAPAPNAQSAPSQAAQPSTATQTAPSNDDLELAFNGHCRECHSFVKDDNRLGPNLFGVVGRKAGTVPNFAYSESVKGSGITWDEPTLDKWITNPNTLIPGNNMGAIFGGVADPTERKKIISFLKQDTQIAAPAQGSPNASHQPN